MHFHCEVCVLWNNAGMDGMGLRLVRSCACHVMIVGSI